MSFIGTAFAIGDAAAALAASVGTGIASLGATGGALAGTAAGEAATGLGAALGGSTVAGADAAAAGLAGAGSVAAGAPIGAGGLGSLSAGSLLGGAGANTTGALLGPAANLMGIAPGAAPAAVGGQALEVPAAMQSLQGQAVADMASGANVATPATAAQAPTTLTSGGFTGFGHLGDWAGSNIAQQGVGGINQTIANTQTEKDSNKIHDQYFSGFPGFAHGGEVQHVARQGGSVKLQDGAFVVPADVVSALGNGSSKAGAKYLTHLMRVLEAGPQQEPKAGHLASQRLHRRYG